MNLFDCHIHLFPDKIIRNVQQKTEMVQQLKLQTEGVEKRTSVEVLKSELADAVVEGALMLPTASVANVRKTNQDCIDLAAETGFDGVEILHKQMHSEAPAYLQSLKRRAFTNGLDLVLEDQPGEGVDALAGLGQAQPPGLAHHQFHAEATLEAAQALCGKSFLRGVRYD